MSELKVRFWVDALRWRAEGAGAFVSIERRGDPDAGSVLIKVVTDPRTAQIYAPVRNFQGEREWSLPLGEAGGEESEADAYIRKRIDSDPDLWVIEIADKNGRHFLTEPISKF